MWKEGRSEIVKALKHDRLDRINGPAASGTHYLESAREALASAERELSYNPTLAYTAAYEAARKAASGLLAQQGLRASGGGHHITVLESVNAQFGDDFAPLRTMRMRRNQLEYPTVPGDTPDATESAQAIAWAHQMLDVAEALMPQLTRFEP
ncbi:MAG: hypothetical protein CVT64_10325 [Actinobacteria bacterium HGW-Actinobacteria-4]|nr:MAG: hypothetical protein CVT64_10325 [Actinobacteria bacterium HGW-Actinobacteria-4]